MIRLAAHLAPASLLLLSVALGPPMTAPACPGRLPAAQDTQRAQALEEAGWLCLVQTHSGVVAQRAAAPAFSVQRRTTMHPEADSSKTRYHFEGIVRIDQAGRYRFGFDGQGVSQSVQVWDANGVEIFRMPTSNDDVTDWFDLARQEYRIRFAAIRSSPRATRFRALWEMEQTADGGFPMEPIPVTVSRVSNIKRNEYRAGQYRNRGRVLLEERGCTNCHPRGEKQERAVGERPAPILDRLADRAAPGWVERWLVDPYALRPDSHMPALLGSGAEAAAEARALTHFLYASAAPATPEAVAGEPAVLARGRELYHTVGCVACHGALESPRDVFGDDLLPGEVPEVEVHAPFGDLDGKWRPAALAAFLVTPTDEYPDGRMPSLGLSKEEADLIATYLASRWGVDDAAFQADPALVERGRELFGERNCHGCHELQGFEEATVDAPAFDAMNTSRGCLSKTDTKTPRYPLDTATRSAFEAGIESVKVAVGVAAPMDEAVRTLGRLGCNACHSLRGEGGVPEELSPYFVSADDRVDLGDEGRLPPDLHHPGAKLTTEWLREVLWRDGRARGYLSVRMPRYGREHLGPLPTQLARLEGLEPEFDVEPPESSDELVLTGRALMGHEALGCMSCHVYKDSPPTGTPGPAITDFAARLRYDWYRTYMQNPQRYKPGSRMPDFGTGGVSSLRTILDGDMAKQADAMWAYFELGEGMPAPEGVEAGRGMQVQVGERPVVMRTFLEDAPSRGIAIGFPNGIHFAFDAAQARLVSAWRGDFLDASGAWAGRGGGVTGGRGETVWTAPPRSLLLAPKGESVQALLEAESPLRYRGYRLDGGGHPTLLWSSGEVRVAERFEGRLLPRLTIVRRFELSVQTGRLPARVWIASGGEGSNARAVAGCRLTGETVVDGIVWHEVEVSAGDTATIEAEVQP